jgi:apolipoprotein N-acyltransferase
MIRSAGRVLSGLLPPLLAGGLIAASLPPLGWWLLAPLGVALLAHCDADRPWRRRAVNGLLAGVGQFGVGCLWALQFTAPGYIVLVVFEAGFVALASALTPPGRGRLPALAGLLTLAEWARDSWPFGGLPLGGTALGQAGGPLLGLARVGGPLLVVGAVCLAGAALERCAGALRSRLVAGTRSGGAAGGAVALALVVGAVLLAAGSPDGGAGTRSLSVLAIQGGGQRGLSALDVPAAGVLAAELGATDTVSRGADLVVWPEDSVSLDVPLARSQVSPVLAATAKRLDATLVVGVTAPSGTGRFLNEAAIWSPAGRYVTSYEKVHAVPFGEYVPFRSLLSHIVSLAEVPRDAVTGHGSGMVVTPVGRLAMLISYETFFSGRGRSGVRSGGELLVVPTNTASYASTQVPAQELAASRLQAVAEGRDLVQVASTGFSAFVDHNGAVEQRSRLGSTEVLRGDVELRDGATIYERLGDVPVLAAALVAALAGWATERRRAPRPMWPSPTRAFRKAPC